MLCHFLFSYSSYMLHHGKLELKPLKLILQRTLHASVVGWKCVCAKGSSLCYELKITNREEKKKERKKRMKEGRKEQYKQHQQRMNFSTENLSNFIFIFKRLFRQERTIITMKYFSKYFTNWINTPTNLALINALLRVKCLILSVCSTVWMLHVQAPLRAVV